MLETVPLRRQRDYRLLWGARVVSEVGGAVTRLAVPLTAVTMLGATPWEMGVLTAAASLPFLLVGLPVGALADRVARRRPVLVGCEVVAGVAILTVPLGWAVGLLSIPWLITVALVVGTCAVVFRNFSTPYLTSVVAEPQRTAAIAGFQSVIAIGQLGGPGVAGLLVSVVTAPVALVVDAVSYLVSAIFLRSIRTPEPARSASPDERPLRGSMAREIGAGLRTLGGHRVLRALVLAGVTVNLCGAAEMAIYVLFAVHVLGLPVGLVGISAAGFGAGGVLGAIVAARLERRFGGARVLLGSVLCFPVGFVALAAASGPIWVIVPLIGLSEVIVGVAVVCFSVCSNAMMLRETPPEYVGRVNASINFATQGVLAVGGVVGGLLGEFVGLRGGMWVCAAGAVLTIPCLWASPLTRRARAHPAGAAESPSTAQHPRSTPAAGRR
ncbi:MFS transporter [Acrocarpospora catenulata]|uniref:MFS transporter n=1 Tax=Acrocarpospora catenulata TaxID=2836182 RepID=UPI001BDAC919|nr:MFS transporter [Acrocarpospora catenulata]